MMAQPYRRCSVRPSRRYKAGQGPAYRCCRGQVLVALSLLPVLKIVRTVLPAPLEHFIAYAGVAAIAMAGYGSGRVDVRIIGGLSEYAGILEYTPTFRRAGIRRSGGLSVRC
jgi:hypothetical protein